MSIPVLICVLMSVVFTFLFMGVFLTREFRCLLKNKKILIPLFLYLVSKELVSYVFLMPFLEKHNAPLWDFSPNVVIFDSTPSSLLILLLWCFWAGWTTKLVLQAKSGVNIDLAASLKKVSIWFSNTIACVVLSGGFFILLGKLLSIVSPIYSLTSLTVIAVSSLIWNLITFALLVAVLREDRFSLHRLLDGIKISIKGIPSWGFIVVFQMFLLGWIVYIPASILSYPVLGFSTIEDMQWRVRGFWTGGYASDSYWLHNISIESRMTPDFFLLAFLTIIFVVFAITIKFKIVSDLADGVARRLE